MPCAICKKPGHNRKTCEASPKTATVRTFQRVPVFTYVDDEGSLNPMYKEDGLEDWMKPASVPGDVFDVAEAAIWDALGKADRGRGLAFEEVLAVVEGVTRAKPTPA